MANPFLGSNINLVKTHNVQALLLTLLYEDNLSRIQLAKRTGLSNTTITNLIAELIEQGFVTEEECIQGDPQVIRSVGRPRTGVCLNPDARYVIGIHIGVGIFRIALTNLRDEILFNYQELFDINAHEYDVLDMITHSVKDLLKKSRISKKVILGIGVGASGLIDFQTGVNVFAPNLNWRDIPIKAYLESHLGLKVIVDNNVRAMALGEAYFGSGRSVDSLAFVYGRVGVGAGFIYKGQVFRGSAMGAGEIGHTNLILEGGEACRCGNSGCLETLVSEPVILKLAGKIQSQEPLGILAGLIKEHPEEDRLSIIFNAARLGDTSVLEMLQERAFYLGVALANMVNLHNPEMIILGGIFSEGHDIFIDPLIKTVRRMAFADLGLHVRIQETSFGWKAGVIGAAALALTSFFYHID